MRGLGRLRQARRLVQRLAYDGLGLREVAERADHERLVSAMGFPGQWEEHRRFQFAFLQERGIAPSSRFLEIGCGPLTLGVPLIAFLEPGRYVGIDVRPSVAEIAYAQIAKHGLTAKNPRIVVSSNFGRSELPPERFSFIWSFSVLYHLTDDLVAELFDVVAGRLDEGGRYWANINVGMAESTWLEFPFVQRDPGFYEERARRAGLHMAVLGRLQELDFRLDASEKDNLLLEFGRA